MADDLNLPHSTIPLMMVGAVIIGVLVLAVAVSLAHKELFPSIRKKYTSAVERDSVILCLCYVGCVLVCLFWPVVVVVAIAITPFVLLGTWIKTVVHYLCFTPGRRCCGVDWNTRKRDEEDEGDLESGRVISAGRGRDDGEEVTRVVVPPKGVDEGMELPSYAQAVGTG
ncbi:hypothetical protein OQA88_8375 [Cercophora sp. LCS_1]